MSSILPKQLLAFGIVLIIVFISSCKDPLSGSFNENEPPSTKLTVERIDRGDDFRLSSQIQISWFGQDPDGFVIGYEFAINDTSESAFTFTTKTDSLFILPITPGQSTDDVLFKVRAVDDDSLRDPVGARLIFPIENTAPEVSINEIQSPPDTLYSISSFGWNFNDPDGILNVKRTEIAINDTINGWRSIPFTEDDDGQLFISLEVDNTTIGVKDAQIFLGRSYSTLQVDGENLTIPVEVGAKNTFYVRAIDAAEAISNVDTLSWYIKQQSSNVLFINDDASSGSQQNQVEHLTYLNEIGIEPDLWIINTGEVTQDKVALSERFPSVIDPTLKRTLAKWDHIYWISNDIDRNITYALDITSDFFLQGGSMFVNIPMKQINQEDEIFNFLPVDSIGAFQPGGIETGFLINSGTDVTPVNGFSDVLLKTESRQVGIFPIKPVSGANLIYETDFRVTTLLGTTEDYKGFEGVAVENAESSLVYLSLDLTIINGNNNADNFLEAVLIESLKFKQ